MRYDVIVVGAGPAGIFTVFQAGMLGMKSCVIEALDYPGGQCSMLYPDKPIYDIPGYPEIKASELIDKLLKQSEPFSPHYQFSQFAVDIAFKNDLYYVTTSSQNVFCAKIVIIAAGAGAIGPNKPPIRNLSIFENKSVFYYLSDKNICKNKVVLIAGGGDSAVDWAIDLSNITKKLYLVHRRNKFRAIPASLEKLELLVAAGKIELLVPFQLNSIQGSNGVIDKIVLDNLNYDYKYLDIDILLPMFGLSQDLGAVKDFGLEIKNHHIQVLNPYYETNREGIYAVGDVVAYPGKLKLILTAFAEISTALHHSYNRVFEGKALHFEHSTTKLAKLISI
ncbi:NAD(P)/FAD-dependent oxidoreductase [Rickettsia endosymbiont of Cardiosporidium cionae]|uniref:NAD(P)/FAD-dependent oxidoreductase n=1 Tax=Rickettsia endosymbiont of Cardiosporidium cionae TaxID=2777155 RepID=UPI0018935FDA|nr:NAD(P)/FAD-dependent oxidoreductase [Rickettsia endosymbiont of Cardiosporidium cionae]KAF8818399.1 NAD(P)/FAD-dependent oxidoreductase [Rickettsia endosymbiont of Cardiosporidium cionae]